MGLPFIFYNYPTGNDTINIGILTTVAPLLEPVSAQFISDNTLLDFTPTKISGDGDITYELGAVDGLPSNIFVNQNSGRVTGILNTSLMTKKVFTLTATNNLGSDKIWIPVSVHTSTGYINNASSFPYYCNVANRKYIVEEDIITDGPGLVLTNSNISIDGNGKSLIYNNASQVVIPNHSFEIMSGADPTRASGWNFSLATGAVRHNEPAIENKVFDGSWGVKFPITNGRQTVSGLSQITLESGQTYTLSAMFFHGETGNYAYTSPIYSSGFVTLDNGVNNPITLTGNPGARGIQLRERYFDTSGHSNNNYYITFGATGSANISNEFLYVDDIKIRKTREYGITTQIYSWGNDFDANRYPTTHYDFASGGSGPLATISNLNIIQGQNHGSWCHGVFIHTLSGISMDNCTIKVTGQNTSCINGDDLGSKYNYVIDNYLQSDIPSLSSRDNKNGAVIFAIQGIVANNTLRNGPAVGICIQDTKPLVSIVRRNDITLKTRYTNSYGILYGSSSGEVSYNTVVATGDDDCCLGIMLQGTTSGATAKYNHVDVKLIPRISEYGGDQANGVYGLQLETADECVVHNNYVRVTATTGSQAHAFRVGGGTATLRHLVYDNEFVAHRESGSTKACSSQAHRTLDDTSIISGNIFRSDNQFFSDLGDCNGILTDCSWEVTDTGQPFRVMNLYFNDTSTGLRIVNPIFLNEAARLAFSTGNVLGAAYQTGDALTAVSDYSILWNTTISVLNNSNPVSGATIITNDTLGSGSHTGVSDINGQYIFTLSEYKVRGNIKSVFSPYNVSVSSGLLTGSGSFSVTGLQTINIGIT